MRLYVVSSILFLVIVSFAQQQAQSATVTLKKGNAQTSQADLDPYDPLKDCLYRWYLRATIIGVVGAFIGIAVIYHQTRETARAARAAEASVKLQEAAKRQWLNLDNWNVQGEIDVPNYRLRIWFQIANPTQVPLTLHFVLTKIESERLDDGEVSLLTPGNPRSIGIMIPATKDQMDRFTRSTLVLDLEISVLFADAFGKHWEQIFGRRLMCGGTGIGVTDTRNTLMESDHVMPQAPPKSRQAGIS